MELIRYEDILKKIGEERDFSKLTEDELYVYDLAKAVKYHASAEEKIKITKSLEGFLITEFTENNINTKSKLFNLFSQQKIWYTAAAAIAILFGFFWLLKSSASNSNDFFDRNIKQETEYIIKAKENLSRYGMIDSTADSRDSVLMGLEMYESKNYSGAITVLTSYLIQYPQENTVRFYLALSQMGDKQYVEAQKSFAILDELKPLEFIEEMQWNYALCLLKVQNGNTKAKHIFEQIAKANGKYQRQATEALNVL